MSFISNLGFIAFFIMFIALILFVIFGQVTVRKLRKNPDSKEVLGIEFISGDNIFNVAIALALPKNIARLLRSSPLGSFFADIDTLEKYTTGFDRFLAITLLILLASSISMLVILAVIDESGVLK